MRQSDYSARRDDGVFGYYDNSVPDVIAVSILMHDAPAVDDFCPGAHANVLIQNRFFDDHALAQSRLSVLVNAPQPFAGVRAHDYRFFEFYVFPDPGPDPYDTTGARRAPVSLQSFLGYLYCLGLCV